MQKRGIKRKAYLEVASEESDHLFAKDNKAKKLKSKSKLKRLSRLEEYDEDEGRDGSRNFQRLAEIFEKNTKGEVAKSKTFLRNFGAKVKKQMDSMNEYMQEQETKLSQDKEQGSVAFEKLHSDMALPPGVSHEPNDKTSGVSKEGHVLFQQAQTVISEGHSLVKQFKDADERLKNCKTELPAAKWKQDKQDVKDLFACGRTHGEKLIESKLAPDIYQPPEHDKHSANEKEKMASDLFKDSRKASNEGDWGTVAIDQVKKFTAIAKTLLPTKISERMYNV